jgi:hypothetical protein
LQNWASVLVDQITNYFLVSAVEIVRVKEDVERLRARRPVGVGRSIDIDIHSARLYFKRWALTSILSMRTRCDAQSESPSDEEQMHASAILQHAISRYERRPTSHLKLWLKQQTLALSLIITSSFSR